MNKNIISLAENNSLLIPAQQTVCHWTRIETYLDPCIKLFTLHRKALYIGRLQKKTSAAAMDLRHGYIG